VRPAIERAVHAGAPDVLIVEAADWLRAYQRSHSPRIYLAVVVPSGIQQNEHVRICFVIADPIDEAALGVSASERLQIHETTIFNVDRLRLCGCG